MDFTLVAELFAVERRHRNYTANGDPVHSGASSPAQSEGGGGLSLQLILCLLYITSSYMFRQQITFKIWSYTNTNIVLKVIYSV